MRGARRGQVVAAQVERMDKQQLIRRLMATFVGELDEHVAALNRDLLLLEKEPQPSNAADTYKQLFRTAHSLKGAARSVDAHPIERACHRLEDLFAASQKGELELRPEVYQVLFATADAIQDAGRRLRENCGLAGAPLEAVLADLDSLASGQMPLPRSESPAASFAAPNPQSLVSQPLFSQPPQDTGAGPPLAQTESRRIDLSNPTAAVTPQLLRSSVRVAAAKLDSLLAQSGELLVARRRVRARVDEVAALREQVTAWRSQWRELEKQARKSLLLKSNQRADNGAAHAPGQAGRGRDIPDRSAQGVLQMGDRLRRLEKELEGLGVAMTADSRQLRQACDALESEVHRVRMLPFSEACQGLERIARDVAQAGGKEVRLDIEGGDVEIDRSILEGLKDPLVHLVRNAVDHGIESPDARLRAGKSPYGRLLVKAALRGPQVEVVVADDGHGVDLDAVRLRALDRGLVATGEERELLQVLFHPGFSTARIITDVSGRGVGLDVVKAKVEALHGTVAVESAHGRGTRFTISAPLTLTTLRTLLVSVGGRVFALASTTIEKLRRVGLDDFHSLGGREVIAGDGPPVPIVSLAEALGFPAGETPRQGKLPAVLVAAAGQRVAFVVDELLVEQEVVVKSLGDRVRRVRHVSGATLLPTGQIALVLNAAELVRSALDGGKRRSYAAALAHDAPQARKRLLIADDSVTTRSLVKSILESSGYRVTAAVDGAEAWRLLQEQGADLVVSDVEMPNLDGFGLAETIRQSKRFHDLPVILVTALDSPEHKARGIEAGANAYLVKSAFDQTNLLETIGQLL